MASQSQIDWHYIHAVLNNLAWLAGRVEAGKADEYYILDHDFIPFLYWLKQHGVWESALNDAR